MFLMLLVLGSTRPSSPNQLGTSIKNLALNTPHILYQIFYPCTPIVSYAVSNILPMYPFCLTYCFKYSPHVRTLFHILYQIFSPCANIVSHTVSNILPVYAQCFTYCVEYSPRVRTLFHLLYQIFSPCTHFVSHPV